MRQTSKLKPSAVAVSDPPGFARALSREIDYYRHRGGDFVLSLAILLASMVSLAWVFTAGTVRDMPIAIMDQDDSSASRAFVRMVDATPQMRVNAYLTDSHEASEQLQKAAIYAAVLIPRGFARELKAGRQITIVGWHSGQFLTISGVLSKSLTQVTTTFSAGVESTASVKRGESTVAAQVAIEPIGLDVRTLFNPFQNYQYFLVAALLPSMLQVFVMVWSVFVVGREFRERTTAEWLSAGGGIYCAIAAKILPLFVVASVVGLGCLAWVHGYAGWPVTGSLGTLVLGWTLMICAYIVLGLLAVGLAPQLVTALSFTAAFTAPAFAYAGITFPQQAMPAAAQLWTYALPIRTLLRLQVEQAQIGAPVGSSLPELSILTGFVLVPLPFVIWRLQRRCQTAATQGQL